MTNLWRWLSLNWGPLGIGTCLGACLGRAYSVFVWFFPNHKALKEEREIKVKKNLKDEVLRVLSNRQIWKAANIAGTLGEDREAVRDCLEDLVMRGRVYKGGGTFDDPAPDYWSVE